MFCHGCLSFCHVLHIFCFQKCVKFCQGSVSCYTASTQRSSLEEHTMVTCWNKGNFRSSDFVRDGRQILLKSFCSTSVPTPLSILVLFPSTLSTHKRLVSFFWVHVHPDPHLSTLRRKSLGHQLYEDFYSKGREITKRN